MACRDSFSDADKLGSNGEVDRGFALAVCRGGCRWAGMPLDDEAALRAGRVHTLNPRVVDVSVGDRMVRLPIPIHRTR